MSNPVAEQARKLAGKGTGGDTHLVHMNTHELRIMEQVLGRAAKNPHTGLPSFDNDSGSPDSSSSGGPGDPSNDGHDHSDTSAGGGAANTIGNAASANNPNTTSTGEIDHTGTTGNQQADNTDLSGGHSLNDGTLAGAISDASLGGFGSKTLGGFLDGLVDSVVSSPVAAAVNAIASLIPGLSIANTAAKAITGSTLGQVAQNAVNGVALSTGAVPENTLAGKIGAEISSLGGVGQTETASAAQGKGPDNAEGGSNATASQDTLQQTAIDNAKKQADQAQAIADAAAQNAQNQPSLAPVTPAQLSATFNQNTGNIFSNLTAGSIADAPGLKDQFSKLALPTSIGGLTANQPNANQNAIPVNINDMANPILALLSGVAGQNTA